MSAGNFCTTGRKPVPGTKMEGLAKNRWNETGAEKIDRERERGEKD